MAKPRQPMTVKELEAQIDPAIKARIKTMRYLGEVPKSLPEGRHLWHNWPPSKPNKRLGKDNFQAWLEPHTDEGSRCHCGWAPGLVHYSGRDAVRRPPGPAAD